MDLVTIEKWDSLVNSYLSMESASILNTFTHELKTCRVDQSGLFLIVYPQDYFLTVFHKQLSLLGQGIMRDFNLQTVLINEWDEVRPFTDIPHSVEALVMRFWPTILDGLKRGLISYHLITQTGEIIPCSKASTLPTSQSWPVPTPKLPGPTGQESEIQVPTSQLPTSQVTTSQKLAIMVPSIQVPTLQGLSTQGLSTQDLATQEPSAPEMGYPYTLDNFIIDAINQEAYVTLRSMEETFLQKSLRQDFRPGELNLYYLYGSSGMGKTHLVWAVLNKLKSHHLENFLYVNAEMMMNDFTKACKARKFMNFRQKYRTPKLLVIDDLQFALRKERFQEEILNIINNFEANGAFMVLIADRFLAGEADLNPQIKSKLATSHFSNMGGTPTPALAQQIFQHYADLHGMHYEPEDVQAFCKLDFPTVGSILGWCHRCWINYTVLDRIDMKVLDHAEVPKEDLQRVESSPDEIIHIFSRVFKIPDRTLRSTSRTKEVCEVRHLTMGAIREYCPVLTLQEIGDPFHRTHSTVLHALKKAESLKEDERYAKDYQKACKSILKVKKKGC